MITGWTKIYGFRIEKDVLRNYGTEKEGGTPCYAVYENYKLKYAFIIKK